MTDKYSELEEQLSEMLEPFVEGYDKGLNFNYQAHGLIDDIILLVETSQEQRIREEERENIIKMIKDRPVQQGWQDRLVEIFGKSIL